MADEDKKGKKEERLFEPEVEGSLEKFEEELLREERRKTLTNFLVGLFIVVLLSGGSYFIYVKHIKPQFIPIPGTQTIVAQKTVPESPKEPVKQERTVAKPDVEPAVVKAEIKEEVLKEAPKATKAKKPSVKKTAEAEKPPVKKAKKTATPERKPKSSKAASVKEKTELAKTEVLDEKLFTLQIGLFLERANAWRIKRKLEKLNLTPTLRNTTRKVKMTTVYVGNYPFREFATRAASDLLKRNYKSEVVITGPGRYELYMGRFGSEALADSLVKSLEAMQLNVRVEAKTERAKAAVVLLEDIRGSNNLKRVQKLLRKKKIKFIPVNR